MLHFFQENAPALASMIIMAGFWFALNFHSVSSSIKNIDNKRIDKNLTPMTDDETQIIKSTLRLSVFHDSIGAFTGGIVALVVSHLLLSVV